MTADFQNPWLDCGCWDFSVFCEHFGEKPCQNHGGYQKNQSFGAKTREGTKKKQSFGALGTLAAQDSNALVFWVFWDPPAFWHFGFFGTLQGFGKVLLQNAPKTLRGPKKPRRGFGSIVAPKLLFSWHFVRAPTCFRRFSNSRNPVSNSMERR